MKSVYHAGELAVQRRAGVEKMAARVGNGIHAMIPPLAADFAAQQPFAIAGSVDDRVWVWASLLVGAPGFMQVEDETTLHIAATPLPGDPLEQILQSDKSEHDSEQMRHELGLLIIDPATRKRMRFNGTVESDANGTLRVHAREVYANCPKYIQERVITASAGSDAGGTLSSSSPHAGMSSELNAMQQAWITNADTFFIASVAPNGGADASHRGGNPGFVQVVDAHTLRFPDYAGNTMFNTLGNIAANPNAGLLFVDWERGDTLQLTGQARILWEPEQAAQFAGAERVVEFLVTQAVHIAGANPLRFRFVQSSRFNPS